LPDRLIKVGKDKEEKLERIRKEMSEKEIVTFKPKTGRNPKNSRNDGNLPI
jgi:hypothetical protein